MDKIDSIDWLKFRESIKTTLSKEEFTMVCELHAKYFKHSFYKPCTCSPRKIKNWIAQLNDIYEQNKDD
tara:strand:- start:482 stop:688 length:207 start_codon:yes stop_codon:yes gene_type:complete